MTKPVLILAGGLGTRLSHVVKDVPKPLAPVCGRPFLEHLVQRLSRDGLTNVVLLTGYKAEKIREHFGDGSRFGVRIAYSEETSPLGTGGALRQALERFSSADDMVLVLNGDTWFDLPFGYFLERHRSQGFLASLALKYVQRADRYGTVSLARERVAGFQEKGAVKDWALISAGVYALNAGMVAKFPSKPAFSLETEVLPGLAAEGVLGGIPFPGRFIDIGVPEDYRTADAEFQKWVSAKNRKAVFLDRDGVINVDSGYPSGSGEVRLINGALDFMRAARGLGYQLVVVTNQAGIAKGRFTEADYHSYMAKLLDTLRGERIDILDSLYCPFHPEGSVASYRRDSYDRKPAPGMILKAAERHSIDLFSSWMVGDKDSDRIQLPYLRPLILKGSYPVAPEGVYESFSQILEVIENG